MLLPHSAGDENVQALETLCDDLIEAGGCRSPS